jgi:hypothetical protein
MMAALALFTTHMPARAAPIAAPEELTVIACGNKKLALYWTTVPNARGYLIYRTTVPQKGKKSGSKLIAKLLKAQDSYVGSPMKLWVDRDLMNEQEYSYTIKAFDAKGRHSASSSPTSAFVDPLAIPFDTRTPRLIVESAIVRMEASDPDKEKVSRRASIAVMSPDGYIYERLTNGRFQGHKSIPRDDTMAYPTAG